MGTRGYPIRRWQRTTHSPARSRDPRDTGARSHSTAPSVQHRTGRGHPAGRQAGTHRHGQAQSQTRRTQKPHKHAHLCKYGHCNSGIAPVRNRQRHRRKNHHHHPAIIGRYRCIRSHTCRFLQLCEGALAISDIVQNTHIEVNEHGVRATAYTGIAVAGAAPQWGREITFTVDRPFMYALMTRDRLPLFVGAVRNL